MISTMEADLNGIKPYKKNMLFQLLCSQRHSDFTKSLTFAEYKKWDRIYRQGASANKLYLICAGRVKIGFNDDINNEVILCCLSEGDVFGEEVLFNITCRKNFAIIAEDHTKLCIINRDQMNEAMLDCPAFYEALFKVYGHKIQRFEKHNCILLLKNPRSRFIAFLKMLKDDDINQTELITRDILIHNPYTNNEFARSIGISHPMFMKVKKELEKTGYIVFQPGKIIINHKFFFEL